MHHDLCMVAITSWTHCKVSQVVATGRACPDQSARLAHNVLNGGVCLCGQKCITSCCALVSVVTGLGLLRNWGGNDSWMEE